MSEKRAIFIIDILKNIVNVYFDTFFVFYFFQVANYEVLPLAKYYVTLYLFLGIGFILIRNAMKKNIKVPYLRIGIALKALYIALIMILKENIINYIFLVGIIKGLADGFYHFPKNILNSEKINNEDRQKFSGTVNIVNKISSIIIPLILGILLTYFSYTSIGKIFFILFIVKFIVSFYIEDKEYYNKKFETKKFISLVKSNKNIRYSLLVPFLAGFTYSSGVMSLIITLSKINNFKTNLNLGFVDSICAILSLVVCILFTVKMKNSNFKKIIGISGIISFISLILMAVYSNIYTLIFYLIVRYSLIIIISLITDYVCINLSNSQELKENFKPEYYCARDVMFAISRTLGYIILLVVALIGGMEYIGLILIIPAISILVEAIIVGKLSEVS